MNNQPQNMNHMSMDDLVYNIETKISLLSQIEQNVGLRNKRQQRDTNFINNTKNEQFEQINLPMQILNKKMMEILNKKQEFTQQHNERTLDKKRMDLNQLQTGTRNIDSMKRQTYQQKSGIKIRHLYNHQGEQVREFKQNQSELYMNESMMNSSKSSSKIINKFNSIQLNYMDKIKALTFKVSFLQQRLQQSQQQKHDIMGSLQTYKSLYTRKQQDADKQVQNKLEQIKSKLIDKFAEQCRLKYNQYISQLKEITTLLNEQKKKRKFYQEQNKVLKLQKENYQQMYKSLLKKQKQYLKIDIDKTRNQLSNQIQMSTLNYLHQGMYMSANNNDGNSEPQYSQIENKNYPDSMIFQKQPIVNNINNRPNNFIEQKLTLSIKKTQKSQKSRSKSKNKSIDKNKSFSDKRQSFSKEKQSKKRVSTQKEKQKQSKTKRKSKSKSNNQQILMKQEMTKQQLIPFLAKGIQELKQRLQMK